jgi:hypothetical protein
MKNDYDITRHYQDDLIKAYNSVAYTCLTQLEAYKKAVKQPAPRYYVSPKQALQVISPMVKGDFERVDMMMPNRKRLYYSLFEKVVELSEKRAFIGKSLLYICQFAVASPAPEFFVSPRAIDNVRRFLKNGYFDDSGKVCVEIPYRTRSYERLKEKRRRIREYREKLRSSPR